MRLTALAALGEPSSTNTFDDPVPTAVTVLFPLLLLMRRTRKPATSVVEFSVIAILEELDTRTTPLASALVIVGVVDESVRYGALNAFDPMTVVPDRLSSEPSGMAANVRRVGPPVSSSATTVGLGKVPPRSPPAAPLGGSEAGMDDPPKSGKRGVLTSTTTSAFRMQCQAP